MREKKLVKQLKRLHDEDNIIKGRKVLGEVHREQSMLHVHLKFSNTNTENDARLPLDKCHEIFLFRHHQLNNFTSLRFGGEMQHHGFHLLRELAGAYQSSQVSLICVLDSSRQPWFLPSMLRARILDGPPCWLLLLQRRDCPMVHGVSHMNLQAFQLDHTSSNRVS